MKHLKILLPALILSSSIGGLLQSQTAQQAGPATVSAITDSEIRIIENDIVPAAEAMPEDKYNFVPTTGSSKVSAPLLNKSSMWLLRTIPSGPPY